MASSQHPWYRLMAIQYGKILVWGSICLLFESAFNWNSYRKDIITWRCGCVARNCSGCPWRREILSYNSRCQAVAWFPMENHVPVAVLIWFIMIVLKPATYNFKNNFVHVYGDWGFHLHSFEITLSALTGHTILRTWRSERSRTRRDGMCKATAPVPRGV